jgi:hypothetical protein
MQRATPCTVTVYLACTWFGVVIALVQNPVFGQANYASPYTITTIAGRAGTSGSKDGTNGAAEFNLPTGMAIDSETNLYVPDYNNQTIRKLTSIGTNWVVTTIAGRAGVSGSVDGTGSAARFNEPDGTAVDSATNIYVVEYGNNILRRVAPVGTNWVVATIAGLAGNPGSADGTGIEARFNGPNNVTVDEAGNLYVADGNNDTVRKVMLVGTNWVVTTIAGRAGSPGSSDGTNGTARFNQPEGVAVDNAGNIYVADANNDTIRRVVPVGTNWFVTTIAGKAGIVGSADGTGNAARFSEPADVALDGATNIYVADFVNYTIRKVSPLGANWVVTILAGKAGVQGSFAGTGNVARFYFPNNVGVDNAGNIYVADENNTIRKGTPPLLISSSGASIGFSGGQFGFALNGLGGQTVVVDASSDLENWLPIWTNTLTFPASINFTDSEFATNSTRFYRARTP